MNKGYRPKKKVAKMLMVKVAMTAKRPEKAKKLGKEGEIGEPILWEKERNREAKKDWKR